MEQTEQTRIFEALKDGQVIPAHPLALDANGNLDEKHQRSLSRYYLEAGAGGLAVGVHTTQFEIHEPRVGLYKPVLQIASEEADRYAKRTGRSVIKIAGIVGHTEQAIKEATLASDIGYHLGLLSLSALGQASNDVLIGHCRAVGEVIPLVGFYLQSAVGGRVLDVEFWRRFAQIPAVKAIKIAPFNRYYTLDVLRGVAESGRAQDIALYTGNDDNIVLDLLTSYEIPVNGTAVKMRMAGGLLGHWAVWTRKAVEYLGCIKEKALKDSIPTSMLTLAQKVTDSNAAFFDAKNNFDGVIVGIHEVLRRQGLLQSIRTLDSKDISPAQIAEIDRVYKVYPELNDDAFVAEHLDEWLA